MLTIDVTSDTVTARMATSVRYKDACLDHTGRYLFCPSLYDSSLRVYDTRADSLIALYQHLPYPVAIEPSPEQHSVYVGCSDVILVYPDTPPGIEETMSAERGVMNARASVIRGVLLLPTALLPSHSLLFSADGRKVMNLRAGANDVRALAPGVYFIRRPRTEDGRPDAAVRKVVVTR